MRIHIPRRFLLVSNWAILALPFVFVTANLLDIAFPRNADAHHSLAAIAAVVWLAGYGYTRCWLYYPAVNHEYADWLAQTPWRPGRPLPFGPAHVWWQDLVMVAIAMACLALDWWNARIEPFFTLSIDLRVYITHAMAMLFLAFTLGFVLKAMQAEYFRDLDVEPVMLAVALPLPTFFLHRPLPLAMVCLLLLAIANVGVLRSLLQIPWPRSKPRSRGRDLDPAWHMSRIGPCETDIPELARGFGTICGALIGWWVYSIAELFGRLPALQPGIGYQHVTFIGVVLGMLAAFVRLATYLDGRWWPIGPITRVATGQIIIPRFDLVFLAPLATVLTGVVAPAILQSIGLPPRAAVAVTFAAVIAVVVEAGPSMRTWSLTGAHRITPTSIAARRSVTHQLRADILRRGAVRS